MCSPFLVTTKLISNHQTHRKNKLSFTIFLLAMVFKFQKEWHDVTNRNHNTCIMFRQTINK